MAIIDLKISNFTKKISALATKPNSTSGLTDAQLKAYWDSSPEELRVAFNLLIDALTAITAASQIGITSPHGNNIQTVLEYIIAQGSGTMPGDNSVGTDAIQDGAVTIEKINFDIATQIELDAVVTNLTALITGLAGTGRTNETVKGTYDLILSMFPAGWLAMWPGDTPPSGWLERDGSAISRTVYSSLFTRLGTTYGIGDGSTTFNLMDDRGLFERGWDHGKGIDIGRTLGSFQDDDIEAHLHPAGTLQADDHVHPIPTTIHGSTGSGTEAYFGSNLGGGSAYNTGGASTRGISGSTGNNGSSTETKVKNRAYMPIIKY